METLAWRRPECRHVDWPVDEAAVATKLITQRVLDVPSRTSSLSYVGTCAADQSASTGGYLGGTHSLRALGAYVQACWVKTISCLYRHLLRYLKLRQQHTGFHSWIQMRSPENCWQTSISWWISLCYLHLWFWKSTCFSSWHFMSSKTVTAPLEIVPGLFFLPVKMIKSMDDLSTKGMSYLASRGRW